MPPSKPPWHALLALAATLAMGTLLSLREIDSTDIGYHLAYGERFLASGRPVDSGELLYALAPAEADARPEPGPGCRWDADGRYRFANANWLSQVLFALAWRAGGGVGLSVAATLALVALLLVHARGLRRLGLPPPAIAGVVGALGLLLPWRGNPRPELLGYLVLSAQLYVLLGSLARGRAPTRRQTLALALLQVLLVNLHSYFLLGLVATGALGLGAVLRGRDAEQGAGEPRVPLARRTGLLFGGLVLASLVNPWTWRVAVLPIETLLFLRANHVGDPDFLPRHPWSTIAEFRPLPLPWEASSFELSLVLFHALLAFTVAGTLVALVRRRLGHAALLAVAALVALSMRRNVPVAAVIAIPVATLVLLDAWRARRGAQDGGRRSPFPAIALAVLALGLAAAGATEAGTRRLGLRSEPGVGLSPLRTPVRVTRWLDEQTPAGRVWTDFDASSNVHFFTAARPDLNVLTNTWAYPPASLGFVLDRLASAWAPESEALGIEVVVLSVGGTADPLVGALAKNPAWALVLVEPRYVVFLRRAGPNAALARAAALTEADLDVATWSRSEAFAGGRRTEALRMAARTLRVVGWTSRAIEVTEARLDAAPSAGGWSDLGALRAQRGLERAQRGAVEEARADLEAAQRACTEALRREPDLAAARDNLALVRRVLEGLEAEPGRR